MVFEIYPVLESLFSRAKNTLNEQNQGFCLVYFWIAQERNENATTAFTAGGIISCR